jgi:hypothetical protein
MTTDGYPKIAGCGNATAVEKRRAIFFYGSWRSQMDRKPVNLIWLIILNEQQALITSSYP